MKYATGIISDEDIESIGGIILESHNQRTTYKLRSRQEERPSTFSGEPPTGSIGSYFNPKDHPIHSERVIREVGTVGETWSSHRWPSSVPGSFPIGREDRRFVFPQVVRQNLEHFPKEPY